MLKKGYTLIELIVAIGLSALFLPAIVYVFSFSLNSAVQGGSYTKAYALAQEQMEAVYYLKAYDPNWDWISFPENNSGLDYYQPQKVDGNWLLGAKTTSPQNENGFTSKLQIFPVRRTFDDISDDHLSELDPSSRKVVVTVDWLEKGEPVSIELVTYVTEY
jgi:prepilin-type N-terminal cleavage/methylation domain-containing protein